MLMHCVKTLGRAFFPLILGVCLFQATPARADEHAEIRALAQAFSAVADAVGLRSGVAPLSAIQQQAAREQFQELAQASDFGRRVRDQIEAARIHELRSVTSRRALWALSTLVSAPILSTIVSTATALIAPASGELGVLVYAGTAIYTLGALAWAARTGADYYTLPPAASAEPVSAAEMEVFFDELRLLGWPLDAIKRQCGFALLGP